MNKLGNKHTRTMRQRIIKRKSPWLHKSLVLRNEKDLRIRECQSWKDHQKMHWARTSPQAQMMFTGLMGCVAKGLSALNSSCLSWTNFLLNLTHSWKHHRASQQIHSESTLEGNNARRCWGGGLSHTVPMLCNASPYEGCWVPKAFETPYKGSLCGFLKLILSESPEANSVQLDYHSLPLNSAVFQCPQLNEFTIFTGSCCQSLIPAMKWAAFSLAYSTGQPTGTLRTRLCSLPPKVHPQSPTHSAPKSRTFLQCLKYQWNHGDLQQLYKSTALKASCEGLVKHTRPHHHSRLLKQNLSGWGPRILEC